MEEKYRSLEETMGDIEKVGSRFQRLVDRIRSFVYNTHIATEQGPEMNLIAKLNSLGEEVLVKYPCVNYGGCCVYAAMVVAELKKHKIEAKGIVASYGAGKPGWMTKDVATIDKAREKVKKNHIYEWQANGISFAHVGIEFKVGRLKKHYDTSGVRKAGKELDTMPIYDGRLEYA